MLRGEGSCRITRHRLRGEATCRSPIAINLVTSEDPFKWLAAGWRDFRRARRVSLSYGLIVIAIGIVLTLGLYLERIEYLIAPFTAGFLFVGPALTVGFYAISRDLEAGRRPSLRQRADWRGASIRRRFLASGWRSCSSSSSGSASPC